MAPSSKLVPAIVLLLLVATEMGAMAIVLPGVCQTRCKKCVGACAHDDECSIICRNEGHTGGECRGAHHRCICYDPCPSPPGSHR
ncbi:hypothetical protein ACP70R_040803 [Stipagrostis hirtigluma subsp. patula]